MIKLLNRLRVSKMCRLLCLIGSGALTGLTVAFSQIGILEWFSLLPGILVFMARATDPTVRVRRLYWDGFAWWYSYSLIIFHFFWYMYPLDFAGLGKGAGLAVVLVAWLGLSLLQTLVGALIVPLFALGVRSGFGCRFPLLGPFYLAALFAVREWGQTHFWTGVPFGRLALGQSYLPVMLQTASLFGSYFITFLLVCVNALLAYALLFSDKRKLVCTMAIGLVAAQACAGVALFVVSAKQPAENTVRVAAIQGNIGSADKWGIGSAECFSIYYDLTEKAAVAGAEWIVWPETAVPTALSPTGEMAARLSALAKEYGVTILIGVFVREDGKEYNTIRAVLPDGTFASTYYAKRHLVPFGEYVPMRKLITFLFPPLADLSILATDLTPGEDASVFSTESGKIGSLICFDSIYEVLARDAVQSGAQVLAISTNDSWFFDSAAGAIHNAQAQLRAIETGKYVVRAANTGISSIITPQGQLSAQLEALEQGIVFGSVEVRSGNTLYTKIGNAFVYVCIAFSVSLLGSCLVPKRKKTVDNPSAV